MNRAEIAFERYVQGGYPYLNSLVDSAIETEIQDFKLANNGMDSHAKKSYSEALSGFANAEGGVIIWGGDCRKNSVGEDVLQKLSPIPKILKFAAELNNLGSQLVAPAIIGVRHNYFQACDGNDGGFAVSYIPEGEGVPHMATGKDLSRYMYRGGSSFFAMPHWMIADRFGRRPHPALRLEYENWNGFCKLLMRNYGAATARYPGFRLRASETFKPSTFDSADTPRGISVETREDAVSGQANNDFVIHPKQCLQIGLISWSAINTPFSFEYELFTDGAYAEDIFEIL